MTLAKGALGGPPIALPLEECHRIVNIYRRKNFKIASGWKTCSEWIEHMANEHAEPIRYKCLEIGFEYIRLPNGMCLKYPDLKQSRGDKGWDEWSYQSGDMRKKIYGGLLTENLVQALARIIVAEQMLMVDKKYPVVMTTHDEAVAHPKKKDGQKCYDFMEKCMTTPMWWCSDIPLAAEGGFADNYSK
jgi:DNA polymerase